jgi:hypothetical protein
MRSWKPLRARRDLMSSATWVSGYGSSDSISAIAASVARHSAASSGARRSALGVRVTFLVRASGPAVVSSHPAARIAATFWLSAEWVRPTERASSAMVIGPWACSRTLEVIDAVVGVDASDLVVHV